MKPENKEKAEKLRKDDARLVKVRYINHQETNGKLDIHYCRWAGEPIVQYRFLQGEEYEIPYGLVKQINESYLPQRSEVLDRDGVPTAKEGAHKRIHEMVPTKF